MKKRDLKEAANLRPALMTSLNQHKSVTVNTLSRICSVLDCRIEDIMEFMPDETEKEADPERQRKLNKNVICGKERCGNEESL
ncbi:MAG: hypothetical protein BI182_10810 [Acetobacterium sp. MES1]|uniref:helix-turn-helix domain-containing protein n=1 Tax=Acetobacterium sp. MES1 TaxID=1899015 RepID=UPI000B9CAD4C|nr:helix-turn-helix transcriptional regulator [Acetobacterium sp. MES1]OXS27171.1 MAG: hypothetical protein BI182_10810 [Acetobacterium sp. MES1]